MKAVFKSFVENDKRFIVLNVIDGGMIDRGRLGWGCTVIDTSTGETEFKYLKTLDDIKEFQFELKLDGQVVFERKVVPVD
jgi:hypothetical protein